jgi:F0F1-type ATP synthase epsilon subunit
MGFNTVVHILNDAFHRLEEHPEKLVEHIKSLMNMGLTQRMREFQGPLSNDVKVMPSHHASEEMYYISGGNTISQVSTQQAEIYAEKGFGYEFIEELKRLEQHSKFVRKFLEEQLEKKNPLLHAAKKHLRKNRQR